MNCKLKEIDNLFDSSDEDDFDELLRNQAKRSKPSHAFHTREDLEAPWDANKPASQATDEPTEEKATKPFESSDEEDFKQLKNLAKKSTKSSAKKNASEFDIDKILDSSEEESDADGISVLKQVSPRKSFICHSQSDIVILSSDESNSEGDSTDDTIIYVRMAVGERSKKFKFNSKPTGLTGKYVTDIITEALREELKIAADQKVVLLEMRGDIPKTITDDATFQSSVEFFNGVVRKIEKVEAPEEPKPEKEQPDPRLTITFAARIDEKCRKVEIKLLPDAQVKEAFTQFAETTETELSRWKFDFEGDDLIGTETPQSLDLDEDFQIDVLEVVAQAPKVVRAPAARKKVVKTRRRGRSRA